MRTTKTIKETEPTKRSRARVVREPVLIVLIGTGLTVCSLVSLTLQYGSLHLDAGDHLVGWAAGLATAGGIRAIVRCHRRWKAPLGPRTAAAAICATGAVAAALVAMVPETCPGGLPWQGRCTIGEAAAWGQACGLALALNFLVISLTSVSFRWTRKVGRDGVTQLAEWGRAGLVRVRLARSRTRT
ncbi:hypothetical protein LUW76_33860 [Actinomadura madurae]|uniref:hypothetical protein n=1 Tax=Actinomadura madurae TaxID=1993 RepID=UPI002026006D|nr:hypothetical protein [Actinomadura madurae]URM98921.1 hypothetical protein LUW76_33860 [Actinomadura madurae]URN09612.1 hypothetical protein LUW74_43860 [Actinomadura madurae]